jgi:hypothetical protein
LHRAIAFPNSTTIFAAFFSRVGIKNLLKNIRFLADNLPWIAIHRFAREIMGVRQIRTHRPFLKSAFNVIQPQKHNLKVPIALSESLILEANFRKAELQGGFQSIQNRTNCEVCLGIVN